MEEIGLFILLDADDVGMQRRRGVGVRGQTRVYQEREREVYGGKTKDGIFCICWFRVESDRREIGCCGTNYYGGP